MGKGERLQSMTRLIDADALKIKVEAMVEHKVLESDYDYGCNQTLDYVADILIDNAPTIEAEPVKHGEWITDKDGYSVCSECGFSFGCIECPHEETDFCPNCGARLDKGGKDECTYI